MSLADNNINDVEEDSDLWFATDLGVSVRNPRSGLWRHYLDGKVTVTLCRNGDGSVWAGTYGDGIYLLSVDGRRLRHLSVENGSLTTNYIFSIRKDRYGELWAGGLDGELMRFDGNGRRIGTYDIRWVHSIEFPDSVTVAAATVNGFCTIDRRSGKTVRYATVDEFRDRNLSAYIVAMCFNGDGTVWLGTEGGGINHYDMNTRQVRTFTMADGLPSNDVYSIYMDKPDHLYLATGKGLAVMSGERVSSLNWMAGLEKEYNKSSFAVLKDGRLAFGSTDGAVILRPDYVREENYPAELRFTGLDEDNISLDYRNNSFSVSYESINYRWQGDIAYRYILEGYDRDWSERTRSGTLRYTNVPPGSYTLKVRNERIGSGETIMEISLPVYVAQPWWNTPVAWLLYIAVSCFTMFFVWRFKKNRLIRRHVEDKIRFFIDTAHDIRTPVTLIKAPLEDIARNGEISDTVRRYLDLAMRNTEKLNSLVGDLLDFEKIDTDKSLVELVPVCLNDIISGTLAPFFLLCSAKGLHLDVLLPEEKVFVKADRHLLEMLLDNLVSNACKYTPEGGNLTVSLEDAGRKAVIKVADTGIGVPKKARKYLFNNVFRAENARNSKEKGSGFGLIQVQRIVKILRGKVECRSEENRGSVFTVTLKRMDFQELPSEEKPETLSPEQGTVGKMFRAMSGFAASGTSDHASDTLLIVEDHDDLRHYLASVFAGDYNVIEACDGEEALKYLENGYPDLILSDVMMPGIQGDELCRRVKDNPETSGIPFILLTAKTNHEAVAAGLRQGADDYIPKPFSPEILKLKVDGMIENRNRQRTYYMRKALEGSSAGGGTENTVGMPAPEAGQMPMSENDSRFVMRATGLVLENISDPEFSIDEPVPYDGDEPYFVLQPSEIPYRQRTAGVYPHTASAACSGTSQGRHECQ